MSMQSFPQIHQIEIIVGYFLGGHILGLSLRLLQGRAGWYLFIIGDIASCKPSDES